MGGQRKKRGRINTSGGGDASNRDKSQTETTRAGTSVVEVELEAELMKSLATLNISNVSGWSP